MITDKCPPGIITDDYLQDVRENAWKTAGLICEELTDKDGRYGISLPDGCRGDLAMTVALALEEQCGISVLETVLSNLRELAEMLNGPVSEFDGVDASTTINHVLRLIDK